MDILESYYVPRDSPYYKEGNPLYSALMEMEDNDELVFALVGVDEVRIRRAILEGLQDLLKRLYDACHGKKRDEDDEDVNFEYLGGDEETYVFNCQFGSLALNFYMEDGENHVDLGPVEYFIDNWKC